MERKASLSRESRDSIGLIYYTSISVTGLECGFFIISHITAPLHTCFSFGYSHPPSFAMQRQPYLCQPVVSQSAPLSAWNSVSGRDHPGPRACTPGEPWSLWLLCQLQWQSERRSVEAGQEADTNTDGCFMAQPSTACSPPSFTGKSPHPCPITPLQSKPRPHKGVLVWGCFQVFLCLLFAIWTPLLTS